MARERKTLEAIIADVRSHTRRSRDRNFGIDEYDNIKAMVQEEQRRLWWDHDWKFLKARWDLSVVAGSRYYNVPDKLCFERILRARVYYSGLWVPLDFGITMDDYGLYDSDNDERSSPAMKFDILDVDPDDDGVTREQIEIWPLSDGAQTVRFDGVRDLDAFVSDDDYCTLDATLITLFTAGKLEPNDPTLLPAANRMLAKMRGREGPRRKFLMGACPPPAASMAGRRVIVVNNN